MIYLIILSLVLAPAYVIHFNVLHLPTDVLMVWVVILWLIFLFWTISNNKIKDFLRFKEQADKKLLIFITLFFLSGFLAVFIKGYDRDKLGQFIVWFLEPISLFFIASYIFQNDKNSKNLILITLYWLLAIAGVYALIQYFTLLGLPPAWWGNSVEPKRSLSFFAHPNFYALWAAPLLALLIPDLAASLKSKIISQKSLLWILGAIGLLFSLSRSGWLGLAAAVVVYLIVAADAKVRKIILSAILVAVLIVLAVPNLRWRLILPFYGEKSAVSRISLWRDGLHAVKDAPVTGLGLTGFGTDYGYLNTDPNLDTHNFPHNIFLNFWVETGLLGLVSFFAIAWMFIYDGFKNRRDIFKLGVCLFLIALICQGQVDNPYFKNDLALIFWIVLALAI